jgi:hypothetical protein
MCRHVSMLRSRTAVPFSCPGALLHVPPVPHKPCHKPWPLARAVRPDGHRITSVLSHTSARGASYHCRWICVDEQASGAGRLQCLRGLRSRGSSGNSHSCCPPHPQHLCLQRAGHVPVPHALRPLQVWMEPARCRRGDPELRRAPGAMRALRPYGGAAALRHAGPRLLAEAHGGLQASDLRRRVRHAAAHRGTRQRGVRHDDIHGPVAALVRPQRGALPLQRPCDAHRRARGASGGL